MTIEEAKRTLSALLHKQQAYSHAMSMLYYDGVTAAPKGSAGVRGESTAVLSEAAYELATGSEMRDTVEFLHAHIGELDEVNARVVTLLHKDIEELRRIPQDEYVAFQKLTSDAEAVWHEAKEKDDYALFEPYLARLVEGSRKLAGYARPDLHPLDYWLDAHEEGLDRTRCDAFFAALRARIVPLLQKVCKAWPADESFMTAEVPVETQRAFSDLLMDTLRLDRNHCGIGETEHPFTINFTKQDVRITTHYFPRNFASSMYSVIHEGGHALYELHTGDELMYTPLGEGCSTALHESQSRFYENLIGRSRAFVSFLAPTIRHLSPAFSDLSDAALYRAFNASRPSLIRTEADELTYSLHIMIRYELEKQLFDGVLSTRELPEAWNRMYKEYLGIDVPTDREGVLQDSHWSGGMFGYFPSYALGSAYGAQLLGVMKRDVDVDACAAAGNLAPVNDWLCERIWKYGRLRKPSELLESALGCPFDPNCYAEYLESKFTELYNL